jgi:small-conductance mechanosensitive channel
LASGWRDVIDCYKIFDLAGKEDRSCTYLYTRLGSYGWDSLSDTTNAYARKALDALATLWSKRNDVAELMRAAARANASERLQEEKDTARALTDQLQTVRAALAASEKRIACYCKLQQEHQPQSPAA